MAAPFPEEQRKLFTRAATTTVEVRNLKHRHVGAGVILTPTGIILTAHHVIEGTRGRKGDKICGVRRLELPEASWEPATHGSHFLADVIWMDRAADLAVLSLRKHPEGLRAARPGDSASLRPGDDLFRVGRDEQPLGCGRLTVHHDTAAIPSFEASMAAAPGSSGGPLFDINGSLVGIVIKWNRGRSRAPGATCIPIDEIKRRLLNDPIIEALIAPHIGT